MCPPSDDALHTNPAHTRTIEARYRLMKAFEELIAAHKEEGSGPSFPVKRAILIQKEGRIVLYLESATSGAPVFEGAYTKLSP